MIYQPCSMKSVIGRIIRNTRLQDSSYISDLHDWVSEVMGMLNTQQTLQPAKEDITMVFHRGKLPCGLVWIDAVEYNGCRLARGNSMRPASEERPSPSANGITVFATKIDKIVPIENHLLWSTTLTAVEKLPLIKGHYYDIEMGYISTSFADGTLRIYYRAIPTDEDGLPLIPDNENYKQAIYWYCRAMMIGTGYPDKTFSYQQCMEEHERYAGRALGEITYPSPDEMEHRVNTLVRFIPPQNYFENFFRVDRAEPFYDI